MLVLATSPALMPIINAYPTASTYPAATTTVTSVSADMDSIRPRLSNPVREDSGIFRFELAGSLGTWSTSLNQR